MKDRHKSPNDDSTELRTFDSKELEKILLDASLTHNKYKSVKDYMEKNSLIYKKVKNTFSYYSQQESVRTHIANQAARMLKKEFNLSSPYTCYTYWSYTYGNYIIRIKYINGSGRYSIIDKDYDNKYKFETNSFKEFFLKIKSLTK